MARFRMNFASRIAFVVAAASGFVSCDIQRAPEPEAQSRPDILWIVSDTLRASYLGIYGAEHDPSPNLDRFARENLIFRRAISPAPWTSPAVASLFTALYPGAHGVARDSVQSRIPTDALPRSHRTLAEHFSEAGYATSAIIQNPWVSGRRGYGQGFERFVDAGQLRSDHPMGFLHTRNLGKIAREEIRTLQADPRPFFFYLHFLDPHRPFTAPRELVDRFHPKGANRPRNPTSLAKLTDEIANYRAEIVVVDETIGSLFEFLRKEGLYEDLIIAFTSDHGEQFFDHGHLGHGHDLYSEEVHVPFFLKAPGLSGEVDSVVSTLDIGPTLLELAGIEAMPDVQGLALTRDLEERKRRGVLTEATMRRNLKAYVAHDGLKLIVEFEGVSTDIVDENAERETVGLFDWNVDVKEKNPIKDRVRSEALRQKLYEQLAQSTELRSGAAGASVTLDPATVEALKSLGYGETDGAPNAGTR